VTGAHLEQEKRTMESQCDSHRALRRGKDERKTPRKQIALMQTWSVKKRKKAKQNNKQHIITSEA